MDTTQLFLIFLLAGLLLMGAEIFVPGGVLGTIGALSLLVAVGLGYMAFGPQQGTLAALAIIVFLGISIALWMILLPKTRLGKSLTLTESTGGFSSAVVSLRDLMGQEGEAVTPLGPSGLIHIGGQRLDALADSKWINAGARVRVVRIIGNHLTVREVV